MSEELNHTAKDEWCPWGHGRCFDVRCDACPNRLKMYPPKPGEIIVTNKKPGELTFVTNTPRLGESPAQTEARYRSGPGEYTNQGYIADKDSVIKMLTKDPVTLPNHYARFKIEPIRFITENKLDFFQGNIVKYVCRHDAKNGREDLKKAARYLEMYIKYLDNDPDFWKR